MTYATFLAQMQAEIGDASTRAAGLILQWTNLVYHEICNRHQWSWLESSQTVAQAAADDEFDLDAITTPLQRVFGVVLSDEVPPVPLEYVGERQYWESQYDSTLTGEPTHYRVWGSNVYLHPIPDEDTNLLVRGKKKVTDLAAGSTILIPDQNINVLYDGVLARAMRYLDDNREQLHLQAYGRLLADAIQQDKRDLGIIVRTEAGSRGRPYSMTVDGATVRGYLPRGF